MMKKIKQFLLRLKWHFTLITIFLGVFLINCTIPRITSTSIPETPYSGVVRSSLVDNDLIQSDGKVVQSLLDFLKLFNIKHEGTVASINTAMQIYFIRKASSERWNLIDSAEDKK